MAPRPYYFGMSDQTYKRLRPSAPIMSSRLEEPLFENYQRSVRLGSLFGNSTKMISNIIISAALLLTGVQAQQAANCLYQSLKCGSVLLGAPYSMYLSRTRF